MSKTNRPALLIVGPIFNTPSGLVGIGGVIYSKLEKIFGNVYKVSSYRNRVLRFIDTIYWTFLKSKKYEIILLQCFGLRAFILEDVVSRIAWIFRKPIVFTIHGGAFLEFINSHPKWVSNVLRRATIINTPSIFLKAHLTKVGYQVEYVPNFIDLKNFPYNNETRHENTLLWVRAFNEIYHPELAIETVGRLKKKYPDVKLTMIGPDQGLKADCMKLIQKLGLTDHIDLPGYIPNNELYKYYRSFQVFLTTTRYESFGVSLIEAGACGIPCVSVAVGEIPYIWTDRENILFANRDPNDFAEKIAELFEDSDLAARISLNAYKNAQKYTWEHVEPLWLDTIKRLSELRNVRN